MRIDKTWIACAAALVLAMAMISAGSPAFAGASADVRKACEKKADQQRPALNAPEREAFIANCLADATPTPGTKN